MLALRRLVQLQSSWDIPAGRDRKNSVASFVAGQQQRQRQLARNPDAVVFQRQQLLHRLQLADVDVDSAETERASVADDV